MVVVMRGSITGPNKEGTTYAPREAAIAHGCPVKYYRIEVPVAFYALECSTKEIADLLVKNGAATEGFYCGGDKDYKLNYEQLVELLDRRKKMNDLETKCFGNYCGKIEPGQEWPEPPTPSKLMQIKYKKAYKAFFNFEKPLRVERKYYSDEECTQEIKEPAEEIMVK